MERHPVEMIRLPPEEDSTVVEEAVVRDAATVFPNETHAQEDVRVEELKQAIGASRFISESQLEENRSQGIASGVEADPSLPLVPLAEVLAENKRKKEEEFQEQWRRMKQGKNRPLDPDEFEFVETLRRQESEQYRKMRDEEDSELKAFQQAVKDTWDQDDKRTAAKTSSATMQNDEKVPSAAVNTMKPLGRIKLVRKIADEEQSVPKKARVSQYDSDDSNEAGLGGLLGDYDSDTSDK